MILTVALLVLLSAAGLLVTRWLFTAPTTTYEQTFWVPEIFDVPDATFDHIGLT